MSDLLSLPGLTRFLDRLEEFPLLLDALAQGLSLIHI